MAVIIASVPMLALAIAVGAGIEALVTRRALSVCLGGAAVVPLVAPDASLPEPEKAIFVLVGLFAPPPVDPIVTLFGASIIGALVTAPLSLAFGAWFDMPGAFAASERAIVALSVFHAVAYTGYIWLVGKAGPGFSSQVPYVVTLSAMALNVIFLGESYSVYAFVSLVLMLAGLALVQPKRAKATA